MSAQTMEDEVFTGKNGFCALAKDAEICQSAQEKDLRRNGDGRDRFVLRHVPVIPYGRLVDVVTTYGSSANLWKFAGAYAAVVIGFCTCILTFIMLAGRITVAVSYDIRQTCFDKLQRLPFSYYDTKAVGWLMARMTSDCSNLSRIMAWSMLDLAWGSCALTGIILLMLWLAWKLALVVIMIAPRADFDQPFFSGSTIKIFPRSSQGKFATTAAFNENIVGVRTSKSMVREDRNAEEFSQLTTLMYGHAVRNAIYAAMFWPIMLSVCGIGTALALRFGGIGVLHGQWTLGALATFLQIVFFVQFPIQELTNSITQIQAAQASAERVQSLLDADVEIQDSPAVMERISNRSNKPADASIAIDGLDSQVHTIEFRDVSFAYKNGRTVLSNFNLL